MKLLWTLVAGLALLFSWHNVVAQSARIVQTNSRSDVIHLIDPQTQTIVGQISGVPVNHGVAGSPDGHRLYISSEAKISLDVVDTASLKIIKEIPLSARPNNISISKDGRFRIHPDGRFEIIVEPRTAK